MKELVRRNELRRNKKGRRRKCYVCAKSFDHFYPYRGGSTEVSEFIREFDIIGSDVDNFSCPHCHAFDRERHLFMYFDRLKLWEVVSGGRVLHVAPEDRLREAIVRLKPEEYVQGDVSPSRDGTRKLDITAIGLPDEHFDLVICNHVLEHVPDDRQAMNELHRVLKKGTYAVIQVPFSSILASSFEDANINTVELRLRFYGQEDHVRVYGQDLFFRLQGVGFELRLQRHQDVLADMDGEVYGVNTREDLILLKRAGGTQP